MQSIFSQNQKQLKAGSAYSQSSLDTMIPGRTAHDKIKQLA